MHFVFRRNSETRHRQTNRFSCEHDVTKWATHVVKAAEIVLHLHSSKVTRSIHKLISLLEEKSSMSIRRPSSIAACSVRTPSSITACSHCW